jgi:hypothetical protein
MGGIVGDQTQIDTPVMGVTTTGSGTQSSMLDSMSGDDWLALIMGINAVVSFAILVFQIIQVVQL